MGIENQIANFGVQAGRDIQRTVGGAINRFENNKRYQNQQANQNKMLEIGQQRYDQDRADKMAIFGVKQQQDADAQEREYGAGWAKAYFSAPDDKKGMILQGGAGEALNRGYITAEEAQGLSEQSMFKLAAQSGVDVSQKNTATSSIGKLLSERNTLNPNDPNRAVYDAAIKKQSVGGKMGVHKSFQPEQFKDETGNLAWGIPQVAPDGSVSMRKLEGLTPFSEDKGLSPTVQKILDKAQTEAFNSGRKASEFEVLAQEIDNSASEFGGGLQARWKETYKDATGNQDAISELRRSYLGVRSSQAVTNLPPGVASDKDIELALSGFPADTASASQVSSFLRGMAKMEQLKSDFNEFKSGLLSRQGDTKNLISKWKEHSKTLYQGKSQSAQTQTQQQDRSGWTLMEDSSGNKALVGPNGEIEEQ